MSLTDIPIYSLDQNNDVNYAIIENDIKNHPYDETFEYKGYKCEISRSHRNTWDGYVTIDASHVCYNINYLNTRNEKDDFYLNVHGGLSYSFTTPTNTVLGFHTCHVGDFIPTNLHSDVKYNFHYSSFKTFEWVKKRVIKLVDQLQLYNEIDLLKSEVYLKGIVSPTQKLSD